jgi:hypothetical protein
MDVGMVLLIVGLAYTGCSKVLSREINANNIQR